MRTARWIGRVVVALGLSLSVASSAKADVFVSGHYRSNGTYVTPYWRTNPDGVRSNNFSYPGNVNPYTGRVAPGSALGYGLQAPSVRAPRYQNYGLPSHR
jgi:hypothetical protein